jgi:hypothetical protein
MRSFLVVLAVVAGCGKKQDSPPPSPKLAPAPAHTDTRKPTGTPRPQSKLTAAYDGKPVAMVTALAWKRWDGTVEVTASSLPVACADVTGLTRTPYDGEVTFDVQIGHQLKADGTLVPVVRQTYFDGITHALPTPTTGSGDGTPDQPTTLDVDLALHGMPTQGPAHALVVKGTIDALGCAATPPEKVPPLPEEMPATLEIAGQKLPVRGAFFRKTDQGTTLALTTGGETCAHATYELPSPLRVALDWPAKKGPAVGQIELGGMLVPTATDEAFDRSKLAVRPVPKGPGPVELHGDLQVLGFAVKLEGKVTAVECPKQ